MINLPPQLLIAERNWAILSARGSTTMAKAAGFQICLPFNHRGGPAA